MKLHDGYDPLLGQAYEKIRQDEQRAATTPGDHPDDEAEWQQFVKGERPPSRGVLARLLGYLFFGKP